MEFEYWTSKFAEIEYGDVNFSLTFVEFWLFALDVVGQ